MNGNFNAINTDAGLGSILSHFETPYINHVIEDCFNMRFRPFEGPMPNIVDIYKRQFDVIKSQSDQSYFEKIDDTAEETYREIIYTICRFYDLTCSVDLNEEDENRLYFIARNLYDIFISNFTANMIQFLIRYIISNSNSIYSYLEKQTDDSIRKPKEIGQYDAKNYLDPKFILIHANLNTVVYNMTGYDISIDELFAFFLGPQIGEEFSNMFAENGNVYRDHYCIYIKDPRYQAGVLTNIKLQLQTETMNMQHLLSPAN